LKNGDAETIETKMEEAPETVFKRTENGQFKIL
jgi:hypothetical protein